MRKRFTGETYVLKILADNYFRTFFRTTTEKQMRIVTGQALNLVVVLYVWISDASVCGKLCVKKQNLEREWNFKNYMISIRSAPQCTLKRTVFLEHTENVKHCVKNGKWSAIFPLLERRRT